MKILIFAETYYPDIMGGGEYSTKQMTEGLAEKGHKVIVYCLGNDDREEVINGVHVHRKYLKGISEHFLSLTKNHKVEDPFTPFSKIIRKRRDLYRSRSWYEGYRSVIRKEAPDVVHTVSPMSYLGRVNLWRAAFDLQIPVSHVVRSHFLLEFHFLGGKLDGYNTRRNVKASSYLTALAAPSGYMLDAHNRVGIRGRRFNEVIRNAVDFEPVPLSADQIEQKENMVLYAGNISKEKGIYTLVRAVERLEGVRLLLIGSGELADTIRKEGKADVLDWMERESLYAYMQKAKAVVLPSEWEEPFGRILIEAIANGTLGIGSDRGGIPEVLGFQKDVLFHSGDAEGLRDRVEMVIRMPSSGYLEEITRQREVLSEGMNDTYVDHWERFFLQQLA